MAPLQDTIEEYDEMQREYSSNPTTPFASQVTQVHLHFPESSPIQQFYKNKSIFITGATGFLGKG
jgi:hypothetical protein